MEKKLGGVVVLIAGHGLHVFWVLLSSTTWSFLPIKLFVNSVIKSHIGSSYKYKQLNFPV